MKHRHKCPKCKRYWPCDNRAIDCKGQKYSPCPKCYEKALNAPPEPPKSGKLRDGVYNGEPKNDF